MGNTYRVSSKGLHTFVRVEYGARMVCWDIVGISRDHVVGLCVVIAVFYSHTKSFSDW